MIDAHELYSIVDVLADPRDSQGITELVTPLKPLEALAMERAVVASGVRGLRELVQDNVTGLIHRANWARHRWAWRGLGKTFERIGLGPGTK